MSIFHVYKTVKLLCLIYTCFNDELIQSVNKMFFFFCLTVPADMTSFFQEEVAKNLRQPGTGLFGWYVTKVSIYVQLSFILLWTLRI